MIIVALRLTHCAHNYEFYSISTPRQKNKLAHTGDKLQPA